MPNEPKAKNTTQKVSKDIEVPVEGAKESVSELAELKEIVAAQAKSIEALTLMINPEEEKEVPGSKLDFKKPYMKHREGGGVRLEQNGKIYTIKGDLKEDK